MAKITSSRFLVTMAARPKQQLDNENFWFMVIDQIDQTQRALYYFGSVEKPPPEPTTWSMTIPPITITHEPLGVAEWGGTAIFSETNQNYVVHTKIWISPDILQGRVFGFGIHPHLDEPQAGTSRSSFSGPFRLRWASPDVTFPGISELRNLFIPKILLVSGR